MTVEPTRPRPPVSDEQLRRFVEQARDLIFFCDPDGLITFVNPAAARILKYAEHELLGRHFLAAVRSDYREPAEAHYAQQRSQRVPSTYYEFPAVAKDGSLVWLGQHVQIVLERDTILGFHGVARDLGGRKADEERIERAHDEETRRAEQLEALGRLVRGVAHDFNNVLAAILGTADLLSFQLRDVPGAKEDADEIRKAAQRGAALARQLLAATRGYGRAANATDLGERAAQMEARLTRLAGDDHAVRLRPCDRPCPVLVDADHIEQLLLNLVMDARDKMPGGGWIAIEITVANIDAQTARQSAGVRPGAYARVAVRDARAAIGPRRAPAIEARAPIGGTPVNGLGLPIVYAIAREAGGAVTIQSSETEGPAVEVLIPLAPSALSLQP